MKAIFSWLIESSTLENIITLLLISTILLLAVITVYQILSVQQQRKFVLKHHLANKVEERTSFLPKPIDNKLKQLFQNANLQISPLAYFGKYIIVSIVILFSLPGIALILGLNTFLYSLISVFGSIIFLVLPYKALIDLGSNRNFNIKRELPDFLNAFAMFIQEKTLYQATIESSKFAGPTLKPYVEQLLDDLKLAPGSTTPYYTFAKEVGVEEIELFFQTVMETVKVDQKRAQEIIEEELTQIDEIQEATISEMIQKTGFTLNTRNFLRMAPIMIFLFVFMFYSIYQLITKSGLGVL